MNGQGYDAATEKAASYDPLDSTEAGERVKGMLNTVADINQQLRELDDRLAVVLLPLEPVVREVEKVCEKPAPTPLLGALNSVSLSLKRISENVNALSRRICI